MKMADAKTKNRYEEVFSIQKSRSYELRNESVKQRLTRLKKLQLWIEKNREHIQQAVHADFRKPKSEVDVSEIYPMVSEIRHVMSHLKQWSKPKKVDAPLTHIGSTSYIQYEPKGVCLILAPWNYPFSLTVGPLISALAAGNTAIIKPSELTPHTSKLVEDMIGDLFPENEVCVFQGDKETSTSLLSLPFDHIFFTGSPAVGKIVMAAAAKNLSSITLELGGKSPVVIDKSANLKDAAEKIAWGKFLNNGQTCLAPDYILVEKGIQDKFIDHLKTAVQLQFDGKLEGFDKSPDYARIVNEKHYHRLNQIMEDAITKGAKVEMGGTQDIDTNFIPPTILSNVSEETRLMQEEIFGPILPVLTFDKLDEAIELVNAKPKPLALYYFGKSPSNRKRVLQETSSGGVCVNDCVVHFTHANLPFGGVNNSGIGKSHGKYGFLAFSNEKSVLKQRVGLTTVKALYPPYTGLSKKIINTMIKYF